MKELVKQRVVGIAVLLLMMMVVVPWMLNQVTVGAEETKVDTVAIADAQLIQVPAMGKSATSKGVPLAAEAKASKINHTKPLIFHQQTKAEVPHESPKARPVVKSNSMGGWYAQAGSFSSKVNAERMMAPLKKAHIPCNTAHYVVAGKSIYRVYLGPFAKRGQAIAQASPWVQGGHMPIVMYKKG
jgi:cell division septation protein DedD